MNTATPCRYTMTSRRLSAATAKNSEPRKKIWTTLMARNGCRYHHRWLGAIRAWSAHGAKVPKKVPTIIPEKANTVVTNDAAHRPPRYAALAIGFVNNIWNVSRWKSRRMDVPKTAAMMMTPNRLAPMSSNVLA